MLTTITPYWGREKTLLVWLEAIKRTHQPGMRHIVIFVGESVPDMALAATEIYRECFTFLEHPDHKPGDLSIGHYHNMGAALANTDWIMKLDVDCIPNAGYFKELLPILKSAGPKEWFNGGMFYTNQLATQRFLSHSLDMSLSIATYNEIMGNRRLYCGGVTIHPSATNFICRRDVYLGFGGCDPRFRGYGWEDYQQIYALERAQLGTDPLPGPVSLQTVHRRCCAEISRRKAKELWQRNNLLCLLHRFHPSSSTPGYKTPAGVNTNREILFDYVQAAKRKRL